ncbi:MAG: hypothetical protein PWP62_2133 [Eubacteriaceae bacterium]|nr:hypothetical protein [Eubacteriaceae bacterium]
MKKKVLSKLVVFLLMVVMTGIIPITALAENGNKDSVLTQATPGCCYQTHVQNVGWQGFKSNGDMSGTSGRSLRLEGIEIKLDNQGYDLGVSYQTHIQNIGWEANTNRGWKSNGTMSGTEGLSYRLEAIQIKLTGTDASKFDVYYQVHAENFGWLGWAKNGESSGTAGYGYRLEGIRIQVVPAGQGAPTATTALPFYDKNAPVEPETPTGDLTDYYKLLGEVDLLDGTLYTEESFTALQKAIINNKVTSSNSQKEIDEAILAIKNKLSELVYIDEEPPSEDIKFTEIQGGIIKENLVLTKDKSPYKILSDIQLSDNATLIVKEGVTIDGNNKNIEAFNAKIQIKGTKDENIIINNLSIIPKYTDNNNPPEVDIEYTNLTGGTPCGDRAKLTLKNSVLKNTKVIDVSWAEGETIIERNIIINGEPIILAPYEGHSKAYIGNNIFEGGSVNIKVDNFPTGETKIQYNSFNPNRYAIYVTNGSSDAKINANDNYWGTVNTMKIEEMIFDRNDNLNSGVFVECDRILKESHIDTPIYN